MISVKCPSCGIVYNVYRIGANNITCQDCGHNYHQGFNSDRMPKWIKSMSVKLSKTLDFWKGL